MFSLYYDINLIKYGKYRNHDEIVYSEECYDYLEAATGGVL